MGIPTVLVIGKNKCSHFFIQACVPKRLGCNKDDDENGDRLHPFGWSIIFCVRLDLLLDTKVYAPM
jgi:hypothetical protein